MPPARKATAKKAAPKKSVAKRRPGPRAMSDAHKSALAQGRDQARIVDRYVRAVSQPKQRGRRVTTESLRQRLEAAEKRSRATVGLDRVTTMQEIRDLRARIDATASGDVVDIGALEKDFVRIAKSFSEKRAITYGAWRDAGVSAEVLSKAGIARTRG